MVPFTRAHLPALLLLGIALLIVVPSGLQVADGLLVTHHHAVERVDAATVDDRIEAYDALSERERWAFDAAMAAGGETTIRSVTRRPREDYAGDASAERYVRYEGAVYRLRSSVDNGPFLLPIFGTIFAAGTLLLAISGIWLRRLGRGESPA